MATGKKKPSENSVIRQWCNICNKTFKYKRDLTKHLAKHSSNAPKPSFQCRICERPFHSQQFLKIHARVHTGEKPYECKICGNRYRFAHGLRNHQTVHTGEKPFTCLHCGKGFAQRAFLTIHLRTHTDERPYACKTCGKAFHQRSHLRYHLLTHSSKSDHKCTICGKKLRYKQSLQLHLRIHNQEKPFSCDVCGKAFYEKPKLTIHRRVHTGEKPYICSICGRGFAQKGNCDKHKQRYHARDDERKFPCHQCPKAFIWKKCLDMHIQWHKLEKKKKMNANRSKKKPKKQQQQRQSQSQQVQEIEKKNIRAKDRNGPFSIKFRNGDSIQDTKIERCSPEATKFGVKGDYEDEEDDNSKIMTSWQDGKWIVRRVKKDAICQLSLRENMAKLLPCLLDDEVLLEIGWPKKPIEDLVVKVLNWCDQHPVTPDDPQLDKENVFQANVRLLLDILLAEKFTEVSNVQEKSSNEIIVELLKFSEMNAS